MVLDGGWTRVEVLVLSKHVTSRRVHRIPNGEGEGRREGGTIEHKLGGDWESRVIGTSGSLESDDPQPPGW